jgi:hypothetical protein
MLKPFLLVFLLSLSLLSVEGFQYMRYRWSLGSGPCLPVNGSSSVAVHCYENMTILGQQTYCLCNHSTNEIMFIAYSYQHNETGIYNLTQWVAGRFFLGGCYQNILGINGYLMLVANVPNVCGPAMSDVIAHGAPFTPTSWAAYKAQTSSPAWPWSINNSTDGEKRLYPLTNVVLLLAVLGLCLL